MGYDEHFVGIIRDGQAWDLWGQSAAAVAGQVEGAIVEVRGPEHTLLAAPDSAEAALYALAAEQGLDPVFPKAVEEEVNRLLQDTGLDDPKLVDRTNDPFVTIDGADSMDLDQAVFVEETEAGHIVHYALADAAFYVQPGTALHSEALRRGASYYLPGIMIPMLPRPLSEGLVSLNAELLRRSVVFSMSLDREGRCMQTTIEGARIRSRGKLSFDAVQSFYDGAGGFGEEVDRSLRCLAAIGRKRMALAEERGVVRYRRREVSAKLSSGGYRFSASSAVRREVERFNEQVSLLCNIEGARYLANHGADFVEPIYRVHPSPSEEKMEAFEDMLSALVGAHSLDPARWMWRLDGEQPLRQFLDALPEEGAQGRIAMAIHRQAVMANLRSTFQTKAATHHGVGAEVYARFSSPMREIVGVFLHRELMEAKAGVGHANAELRNLVVERANEARDTQRSVSNEGNRLVIEQLFEDAHAHGKTLSGTLMGAMGSKAYVRLDEPPIDIKVYLKLAPTPLTPKDGGATLVDAAGHVRHRLGDAVGVRVVEKDGDRDRWVLELSLLAAAP